MFTLSDMLMEVPAKSPQFTWTTKKANPLIFHHNGPGGLDELFKIVYDIFKPFIEWNGWYYLLKISKAVLKVLIDNRPTVARVVAWRRQAKEGINDDQDAWIGHRGSFCYKELIVIG